MAEYEQVEQIGNLHLYPTPDKESWRYVPTSPGVESTPLLIISGRGGQLNLETSLFVYDEALHEARRVLAHRDPQLTENDIELTPIGMSVGDASLVFGNGRPDHIEEKDAFPLVTQQHAGFHPYQALFSIQLTAAEKEACVAAFNGRANFLRVAYHLSIAKPVWLKGELKGDVRQLVEALADIDTVIEAEKEKEQQEKQERWFFWRDKDKDPDQGGDQNQEEDREQEPSESEDDHPTDSSIAPIEITEETAIELILIHLEKGAISYQETIWGEIKPDLPQTVFNQVLHLAALQLVDMAKGARTAREIKDKAKINVKQTETGFATMPFTAYGDIASLLDGRGKDCITVSPFDLPEPAREENNHDEKEQTDTEEDEESGDQNDHKRPDPIEQPIFTKPGEPSPQPDPVSSTEKPLITRVEFDFDPDTIEALPVREVELYTPDNKFRIKPKALGNGFAFQTPLPPETPLKLNIRYTSTSRQYETLVNTEVDHYLLSLEDLGVFEVIFDGERLKKENARRLQIKCVYEPDGDGKRERLNQSFSDRDPLWRYRWFIITQASDLNGTLIWEYRLTPERGSGTKVGPEESKEGEIIF